MNLIKKIRSLSTLMFCCTLLVACSDNESDNEPSKNKAVISFIAGDKSYTLTDIETVVREGYLNIEAKEGKQNKIWFDHRSGIAPATFALSETSLNMVYYPQDGGSNYGPFNENPIGKVTITSIDEENQIITGTFEGTLVRYEDHEDHIDIKNGTFILPYTVESNPSQNPYFLYKIDGNNFVGGIGTHGYSNEHFFFSAKNNAQGVYIQIARDEVGTYTVGSKDDSETYARYWDGIDSYGSVSGTVTITSNEISTTGFITGSYAVELESFPVGGNHVSITEGTFTIHRPR